MSGRTKLIIGNWKMHFSIRQSVAYARKLAIKQAPSGVKVIVAPHTLALASVRETLGSSSVATAAQNAYFVDEGAYTGEISMPMLRDIARYVIIGHSERRVVFHEQSALIRKKTAAAVRSGIIPVLCVGETLLERQHYHTTQVLNDQVSTAVADLTSEEIGKMIIAYEPVWAISNGRNYARHKVAHPDDVASAVGVIRNTILELYGSDAASKVRVLYGGSVSADNAAAYLSVAGVDGLLVGGASLSVATFWPLVDIAGKLLASAQKEQQS